MSVGDVHISDTFGWPLCGSNGPLRGYNATSPRCQDCDALEQRTQLAPAVTPPQMMSLAPGGNMNRDTVNCFWCGPSDRAEESLRRFVFSDKAKCTSDYGYHNADVVIAEIALPADANASSRDDFDRADPRWPTHCACGYVFQPADTWQHNVARKYRRTDTGALYVMADFPPGAMYDAEYGGHAPGPDGIHLIVVGPAKCGSWYVDGGSKNGGGWTRTGDPRKPETLSCAPSIWWGQGEGGDREWHGYLTNGVLKSV